MKYKAITLASTLLGIGFSFFACGDQTDNPVLPTTFTAALTGASEKPSPTSSRATGSFKAILDETSRVLSYTVVYDGLTPTQGHLHRIDTTRTDGTGPVDISFPSLTSPVVGSTSALTPLQIYRLKHGQYYANLHSSQYPSGEIRGDIRTK